MKINIFGVARSGTKAVQLYLTYVLAQKAGKAWLNYEPYLWQSRKGKIGFSGAYHHLNDHHILTEDKKLLRGHTLFLESLVKGKDNVVTKFIRGNGRLRQINEVIKPDFSVFIIRPIYDVLSSIITKEYSSYSIGYFPAPLFRYDYYIRLLDEAVSNGLIEEDLERIARCSIHNRILKDAFTWYLMNKAGLRNIAEQKIYLLEYSDIIQIETIARHEIGLDVKFDKRFKGYFIHSDSLLTEKTPPPPYPFKYRANELMFRNGIRPVFPVEYGEEVYINPDFLPDTQRSRETEKVALIKESDLLNALQDEISELIEKRKKD